jgi:hypothetical protein
MKITSDLTNLTTVILILTAQIFFEWTLCMFKKKCKFFHSFASIKYVIFESVKKR